MCYTNYSKTSIVSWQDTVTLRTTQEKGMVFFLSTNFMIIIILAATLLLHVACASDIHIFFSVIKDRRGGKVTEQRSIAEPKRYIYRRCSGMCPPCRSVFWYSARIAKRQASEMRCQVYSIVHHNFIWFDTS